MSPLDPFKAPQDAPAALLVASLVEDSVAKLLKRALADYRNNTLTDQHAYGYIAQIAALQSLTTALEDRIKHHKA